MDWAMVVAGALAVGLVGFLAWRVARDIDADDAPDDW